MKNQTLFSWKDRSKRLNCHLLKFLFGSLRVTLNLFLFVLNLNHFMDAANS